MHDCHPITWILIWDHKVLIKFHLIPESVTYRAGSERIVERETSWFYFINADSAIRAGEILRKIDRFTIYNIDNGIALCKAECILQRICKTVLNSIFDHKPVDHNIDIVLDILLHRNILRKVIHITIYNNTDISALLCFFKKLLVFSLTSSDDRCKDLDSGPFRQRKYTVNDLIDRLLADLFATFRTMYHADPGIKESEIIINLRYGSNRGPWITVR